MNPAILYTIGTWEGGYSDTAGDKGGETKFGISKKEFPDVDIPNLILEQAVHLYEMRYWRPLSLDEIKSVRVAWKLFDIAVNQGPDEAAKILQRSLIITADGIVGPVTISAANQANEEILLRKLAFGQMEKYVSIVISDPSQLQFLRGWFNRCRDVGDTLLFHPTP
jgi:lysozyme family protein